MTTLDDDVPRTMRELWRRLLASVNFISFGDGIDSINIDGQWLTFLTDPTPDTQFSVTHGLKRIPVGYIVMGKDRAADLYDGTTAWTIDTIYWRCNVASAAITVFLI